MLARTLPATMPLPIRRETLRIAGKRVATEAEIEVRNPYSGALVGTVARADASQIREAFEIAGGFRARLSRYERQKILFRAGELIAARRDEIAALITAESGLCLK